MGELEKTIAQGNAPRRRTLDRSFYRFVYGKRDLLEKVILAAILPGVAGAMNASGFFVLGIYTSHMTGLIARIGDELAKEQYGTALHVVWFVASFFFGAASSAFLVELGRARRRGRYFMALMLEAIALGSFAVAAWGSMHGHPDRLVMAACLLCYAMGAQNALVTRISGAVVRTTHLTGIVTDLGIESVRVAGWYLRHTRGRPLGDRLRAVRLIAEDTDFDRLRLHVVIFVSFFSGAVVGPVLYVIFGVDSMALPVAVVVALAIFDATYGISHSRLPESVTR